MPKSSDPKVEDPARRQLSLTPVSCDSCLDPSPITTSLSLHIEGKSFPLNVCPNCFLQAVRSPHSILANASSKRFADSSLRSTINSLLSPL